MTEKVCSLIPAISIVMPAYNAEKHILEAIESVLGQTFSDFEFIIIDDGSTDNTVRLIRSYSDPRIVLLENRHDFIASLNLGINRAQGKYIARMDADDRMFPDRLKIQYEIMEAHPEITVCSSWMQLFNSSSVGDISKLDAGYIEYPILKLLNNNIICHPATMIRRDFLVSNQIQYEYYPHAEDYRLWFRIAKSGGIFYTEPQALLYYRVSENQVSNVFRKEQQETSKRIRSEILNYLINQNKADYPELFTIYENLLKLEEKGLVHSEYTVSFFSLQLRKIISGNNYKPNLNTILPVFNKRKIQSKTSKQPLISVVMPVYNMENFVSEAMESILNQSFSDFEFIIIDDASTDNTKNILDSEKDSRIIRINNSVNEGNYSCRNKGLDISIGKYLCVMDADDISLFDRLEKQYYFMENNSEYAAAGTDIKFFSENTFPSPFQRLRNEKEIKVRLLQDNVCTHPTLILRKEVLLRHNIGYNEEYYYVADYNLLVDISRAGNITNIPEFLLFYRKHPKQITSIDNKAQEMYRNRIQLKQLNDFKIRPAIDEVIVHHHLMNGISMSKNQLNIAEKWCNKLLVKNHKLNIFDKDYLYSFLEEKLFDVALKSQRIK